MIEAVVALDPARRMTAPACAALGISAATVYRHRAALTAPETTPRPRPKPPRALLEDQTQAVLDVLHEPRFVDQATRRDLRHPAR